MDMRYANSGPRRNALENAIRSIDKNQRFPANVFSGRWTNFNFFDSDWIFDRQFVDKTRRVLEAEGGTCICLLNLDELAVERTQSSICIDKEMTSEKYVLLLNHPSVADGWVSGMNRFVCASDTGQWSFYCEKTEEVAVIALKENAPRNGFESFVQQFGALPISQAMAKPLSYNFSRLLPEWRDKVIKAYEVSL